MRSSFSAAARPAARAAAAPAGSLETALAVGLLLSGAGLFLDVLPGAAYDAYWAVFAIAALLLAWRLLADDAALVLLRLPLLLVVLGVACLSVGWSIAPERTLRVAVALVGTTLVGCYVGCRFEGPALLRVLGLVLVLLLLINAAVALAPVGYGTEPFARGYLPAAWKGAARHRNALGAHASLAVLLAVVVLLQVPRWRRAALAGGALAALVLVMAQSMTSVAATAVGLLAILAFWQGKLWRVPTLVVAFALGCCGLLVAAFAVLLPEAVAIALGRDPTLTSRVDIWADALWIIAARPLAGHGFGAVWSGFEATAFPQLATMRWSPHAHNGFLQLATEIGVPASTVASLFYLTTLGAAIRHHARRATPVALLTIGVVVAALVLNLSEAWLFAPYELFWMVFVTLATAMAATAARGRRRPVSRSGAGQPLTARSSACRI